MVERLVRVFPVDYSLDAQSLAQLLGEVRGAMIPNYERAQVLMNVSPPITPTNGGVFSGMNPKAIHDPVARAAYEKAIAENNRRAAENKLQLDILANINRAMTPLFLNYGKALLALSINAKCLFSNKMVSREGIEPSTY